jgi:transposase InsO family protein
VLSFSGWRWPLVVFSENFETLSTAVQGALWELGGAAEVLRSDNLSAATHQLYGARGRVLTKRYRELLDHYGMRASPITPGHAHENGVVEQAHRRSKSLLAQALLLRRSRDFVSIEDYQSWVRATIEREHNHLRREQTRRREAIPQVPARGRITMPHDHPGQSPPLEHDSRSGPDLLSAGAADW